MAADPGYIPPLRCRDWPAPKSARPAAWETVVLLLTMASFLLGGALFALSVVIVMIFAAVLGSM